MDDFRWPRVLNRVLTSQWHHLKSSLVIKDFVDHLIQKRVVTLEYWMNLKAKPVTESERTEDFLSMVMKFDRQKYNKFLEALLLSGRHDLVKELAVTPNGALLKGSTKNNLSEADGIAGNGKQDNQPRTTRMMEKTFNAAGKATNKTDIAAIANKNNSVKDEMAAIPNAKEIAHKVVNPKITDTKMTKTVGVPDDEKRKQSTNSRESSLDIRELQLRLKETELEMRHRELEEQANNLKRKGSDLSDRENTFATDKSVFNESNNDPQSLPMDVHAVSQMPASAFSTESEDILALLREQLAELKGRMGETEDVQTPIPYYEYVKLTDIQNVQNDIDDMKEVIHKDKEHRERIEKKHGDQKRVIESLNEKIASLERQKNESERHLQKQVNKLTVEVKNSKVNLNENMSSIRTELKSTHGDCEQLSSDVGDVKQTSARLEDRVAVLERDNALAKIELQKYEKRISELQTTLDRKEGELGELRTKLEGTTNDRSDLLEEVTDLKDEVSKLQDEKTSLELERKSLLGKCVKPPWKINTRYK